MPTLSLQIKLCSLQLISRVRLFGTPWTAALQASLSITNTQSLLKFMSIETVMPSNHLILCHPLLLPPSIFPSIKVFSNESVHHIRWPKYWCFSFSIILPLNIQDWLPLGLLFSISTTIFWVWATIIICLDFLPSLLFLPCSCFLVFHIITN